MTGTAISMFLLVWFRERFQTPRAGAMPGFSLSANAFAVYVFHTPILIALSRWISPVPTPLLLKLAGLTLSAIHVSVFIVMAVVLEKIPLLEIDLIAGRVSGGGPAAFNGNLGRSRKKPLYF